MSPIQQLSNLRSKEIRKHVSKLKHNPLGLAYRILDKLRGKAAKTPFEMLQYQVALNHLNEERDRLEAEIKELEQAKFLIEMSSELED